MFPPLNALKGMMTFDFGYRSPAMNGRAI